MGDEFQSIANHASNMFLYSKTKHSQVVQNCALIAFEKGNDLIPSDLNSEDMLNYFGYTMLEEFFDKYNSFI
jgi:hypothetical protein